MFKWLEKLIKREPKPVRHKMTFQDVNAKCQVAPKGWVCTRKSGHEGPCAAWPV
jgi:hypothetical protein